MANPSDSTVQNLLPVQAYFDVYGNFQTFIGQGKPFYAVIDPNQSGLNITNSTINSTTIGVTTPAVAYFTSGYVSVAPTTATGIANKQYVDYYAAGLSWKQPVKAASLSNIASLSGFQTIDAVPLTNGDRILVKNQSLSKDNGIYVVRSGAWEYAVGADNWEEYIGAIVFVEEGSQAYSAWYSLAQEGGTLGVTALNWANFSVSSTYTAGTGLTLNAGVFSITNTGVSANTYGSATTSPTIAVNAQGQITSASNTTITPAVGSITGLGTGVATALAVNIGSSGSVLVNGGALGTPASGNFSSGTFTWPTFNQNTTGTAAGLSATLAIASGGTGQTSASAAFNALSPITTTGDLIIGNGTNSATRLAIGGNNTVLTSNGTTASWVTPTNVSTFSAGTTGFTPSSATSGAVTLAGTLNVVNGGTGVTVSSGANSVVLRDANQNVTANAFDDNYVNTAASGTQITLTNASSRRYTITGSGGQVIKLPDATTLVSGATFLFDNNQSSGAITLNNNSNTLVVSVPSGGSVIIVLLSNATTAGSWDRHDLTPSNVSWSTNTLDYSGSITSATWNGNVIAYNRGGTGQSALFTAGGIVYGASTTAMAVTAAGTTGQVLTSAGAGAPTWTTPSSGITITDDTTTNATRYLAFTSATSGTITGQNVASTKLQFNPSSGALSATSFSGSGSSLTGIVTSNVAGTGISVSGATGAVTITNTGVTSLTGTANQVTVSASTGSVTLSTPQSIATGSSVQFGSFGVGTAASGTTGEIRATNNVTAYYSDDRLKTKLGEIENALDKVCSLSGFYYEANETAQALGYKPIKEVGVSAQQVQAIMPEVVAPAPIDEQYLTVRYERLMPLMIEAIKELRAEIKALKGE